MFSKIERYRARLPYKNEAIASSIAASFSVFHPYRGESPLVELASQRLFEKLEDNFNGWLRDSDLYAIPLSNQENELLAVYVTHGERFGYSGDCPNDKTFGCSDNHLIFVDRQAKYMVESTFLEDRSVSDKVKTWNNQSGLNEKIFVNDLNIKITNKGLRIKAKSIGLNEFFGVAINRIPRIKNTA